jgi:hypothetical protein
MKYLFLASFALFSLVSCEEKSVVIPQLEIGERKILVEELTGVRCLNCPNGAAQLQELAETLGDKLIVVGLHATVPTLIEPYAESKYDFRTPDGRAIADYIYVNGDPGAPAASIDREMLANETGIFINLPWKGAINARAAVSPNLGLFLDKTYNASTRSLEVKVSISPDEILKGEIRLSVYITEDSIVDVQQKGLVRVYDYVHRHVFRDALSAPTGDNITAEIGTREAFSKTYTVTLPAEWNADHCSIVAFVHKHGDFSNRQVLQAEEVHLK